MNQSFAFKLLKTGVSVFLTGEAGSGKTYLVNTYIKWLRGHGIQPAITASTGIAATHIGGMTIHSWSGIGIKDKLDKRTLKQITDRSYIRKRIEKTEVLIVDEVSMLSPNTLGMVDLVCRTVRKNLEPFGGMQVVLVGDFFQLPPVVKREMGDNLSLAVFAYEAEVWKKIDPVVCYLDEQFRQDDEDYLSILSAIRRNEFGQDHLSYLEKRKIEFGTAPKDTPWLFSHNRNVDSFNENKLSKLAGEVKEFEMTSVGAKPLVEALVRGCLSPKTLRLKKGAVVTFTKNNPKLAFVNGTLGVVCGFDKQTGWPQVKIEGRCMLQVKPMDWMIEEGGKIRASVSQFPLRLAWAITVHKSQGLSLDRVTIDLSKVFEYGQGYVALSRVRRLKGLYLLGWNAQAFRVHPSILEQDNLFRRESRKIKNQMKFTVEKIHDFIVRAGGSIKKVRMDRDRRVVKPNTQMLTLELWQQGKGVVEIAKERGLKDGTIVSHVEALVSRGQIDKSEIERLLTPTLRGGFDEIKKGFKKLGVEKLSPVYNYFNGVYSYDDLRVVRMMN